MNYPVLRHSALAKAQRVVSYLTSGEVRMLSETALKGRQGEEIAFSYFSCSNVAYAFLKH
jgi:hypothetical protein